MLDAIIAEGLTKYYGDFLAVDHINFRVRKGEIYGFLGPNGAGKTTTVRMLCGLTRISEGEAYIMGHSVRREIVSVKNIIGVVPDISNLYWDLSVFCNLMFTAEMFGVPRKERRSRVLELLKFFGLADKQSFKFKELSKGLKRRLTIAAALVHNPKVLFLDEPTIGLDVKAKRQIWDLIVELNSRGLTIFLTTHNIYEAFRLCDRIAIINKGKIVAEGTPSELRRKVSGERILEFQFSSPIKNVDILRAEGVIKIQPRRDGSVIVLTDNPLSTLERILERIKSFGLEVVSLSLRSADAEDVFIKLIEKS